MEINEEIRRAITEYMEAQGLTAQSLANRLGIYNSTVSRWITTNGAQKVRTIRPAHWAKLRPLIQPYLDAPPDPGTLLRRVERLERTIRNPRPPDPAPSVVEVPIRYVRLYGFANGAPSYGELVGDVIPDDEDALEQVPTANPRAIAAFRVVGQSMEPDGICDGSTVTCERVADPAALPAGTIVVVKHNDTLFCKHWRKVGDTILLTSSAPGGKDLELHGQQPEWVLRAVEVTRRLG